MKGKVIEKRDTESSLFSKWPQQLRLGQAEAEGHELCLGLPLLKMGKGAEQTFILKKDTQMSNKYVKSAQQHQLSEKCKLKSH